MSLTNKFSAIKKSVQQRAALAEEKRSYDELVAQLKEQKKTLDSLIKSVNSVDKSISLKEYPDKIEVTNFPQQKAVEVKKPSWLKQFSLDELLTSMSDKLSKLVRNRFRVNLDEYRTSKNAIAVRLSDGQTFINQLASAVGMAGGGRDSVSIDNIGDFPDVGINLPEWNSVVATYPTTSTEVYTFTLDSVEVATVTVTYTDAEKEVFVSAVVSKP